jgi:hypothetical protein
MMLSKEAWNEMNGYTVTEGNKIAGCDMWHVARAVNAFNQKHILPFPIYHIEHPGRALDSGYGITKLDDNWGAPFEVFPEHRWSSHEKN